MDDPNRNSTLSSATTYRFGLFCLDLYSNSLSRNGVRIKLQDQPFQLLAFLVEKHGQIATREEIRQRLWPSNTFVDFDKSLGVAVVKVREALGDSAANPRFLETVPRRGYRFIAPVSLPVGFIEESTVSPASLPGGPTTLRTSEEPAASLASDPSALKMRPHKVIPILFWYSAGTVGVALAVAFTVFRLHPVLRPKAEPSPPIAQTKLRRSVAVLGFRNVAAGPDQNWLSTAFTEMLNTELSASGDLRLVSGEDVASVKHDLSLPAEDTLAKSTLTRLRTSLGADVVVVGSYTLISDGPKNRIRLDMRVQDTGLGETIFESSITGDERDLFDLASQAGSRLRESLDPSLSLAPPGESSKFEGSINQLAIQFYSEGLARLYEFDSIGARDLLKRAVDADPRFAEAHSALSSAYSSLGFEAQEREEARRALQHMAGLPEETALSIQGRYQESISDWPKAAQTYQKLFQLFPDNLTYGLKFAGVQLHVNPTDSEHTLASLRLLPSPLGDDPRIDIMEASALVGLDMPRARAAAQKAIAKASIHGSTLTVARGYGILCQLNAAGGQSWEQSVSECNHARNSYISAGDQNNAARTLNDFAGLFFQHGDLAKAQNMWQEAIEVFRRVGDTEGLAASSNNLGDVLVAAGEPTEASKLLRQAIAGYKRVGDESGVAVATVDLGEIALRKCDLPEARRDYQEAIAIGARIGDKSASAFGYAGMGEVLMHEDQLAEARKQLETALQFRTELGEEEAILQTKVALDRLAIEDGHTRDAETDLRQSLSQLHKKQLPDDELEAGLALADALIKQGKNLDAAKELVAVRPIEEKTLTRRLQLRFSINSARVALAGRDFTSSKSLLSTVVNQAEAGGFSELSWEAKVVKAEIQGQVGDLAGATVQLRQIEGQERKAGLLLLARNADAARTDMADSSK